MTWSHTFVALSALTLAAPALAQDESPEPAPDPVAAAQSIPIIVTATREEDEVAVRSASRIPKKPRFTNENIRSETGIAGLTPGSGMTPLAGENATVKKRIVTCKGKSNGEDLSERAACLIGQAKADEEAGEIELAKDVYRYIASSGDFTTVENRAGGNLLYGLAEAQGDDALREEALIRMLAAEALERGEARRTRRTLVAMALKRQDNPLAIARLEDVVSNDPTDARSLANLAILLRNEGRDGAETRMQEAIAAQEARGLKPPKAWRDFISIPE